jgi:pimeloyl-ACP methyl ester carboxylesterase
LLKNKELEPHSYSIGLETTPAAIEIRIACHHENPVEPPMTKAMPIVLVPGLNCTARVFAGQIPDLWRFGPVTIANHMQGDTIAAIASNILDDAPSRFALVGFSFGGYIAFEIMRQAANRVEKLALLDTSARAETAEQAQRRQERIAMAGSGRYKDYVDALFPMIVHPSRRDDEALLRIHHAMADEYGSAAFMRHSNAILKRADSRGDLASIGCPTLVLVGDSDELTPPDCAEEMAAVIPGARLVVVPECGHMSPIEKPEAVTKALVEWMGRPPTRH